MAGFAHNETLKQSTGRSIELLFASYLASGQAERKALTELDIRQVSDCLRRMGKDSWSKVPRLYTVLRLVDQVQVIDSFVAQGITDIWFPFSLKTLPDILRSPSSRYEFIEAQDLVLTKAFDLEREDGKHRHFAKADDVPMHKIEELGKGVSGFVDRVVSTITYKEYARKLIPRGRTFKKNREVLRDFERELGHLKKLSHIHIVELIGSYTDPKYVGIIMSPVAEYNLNEFLALEPLPSGSLSFLRTFFGCLATALSYLHDHQIRHKDIKPQNVLVKGHQVFLTDFGISLDWSELGQSTTTGVTLKTPRYCAPEVAQYMPRNSLSDMWSLGCVFLEIWTVLKGRRIAALFEYLKIHGSKSTCYYLNRDAAVAWCGTLEADLAPEENLPLPWIFGMLQPDQDERWTAQKLLYEVQEVNENLDTRVVFSGLCCVNNDDSTESANSSKRSSRNVEETCASKIGAYYNSRLVTQDIADEDPPTKKLSSLNDIRPSVPMRLSLESPDPGPAPLQPVNDPGPLSIATEPAQDFQPTDELDAPQMTSFSIELSKPVEVMEAGIIKSDEQGQINQDAGIASRLYWEKIAPTVADGNSREHLYAIEDTGSISGLHEEYHPSKFKVGTIADKTAVALTALSPVSRVETNTDESQCVADVATRERMSADGTVGSKEATSATKASLPVPNTSEQNETWVNLSERQFNVREEKTASSSGSFTPSTDDETTLGPLRRAKLTLTGLEPAISHPTASSPHKRDLVSWWRQLPKEYGSILIPAPESEPEPGLLQRFKSRNEELQNPAQVALKKSSEAQAGVPAPSHVTRDLPNERGISNRLSLEPAGTTSQKVSKADDTPRRALTHALSTRSSTSLFPSVVGSNIAKTQRILPLHNSDSAADTNLAVKLTKQAKRTPDLKRRCSACHKRFSGQNLRALGGTHHRASIDQLQEMQVQTQLAMLQLSSKIDDLKQLSLAMQVKTDTDTSTSHSHRRNWNTQSIFANQVSGCTNVSLLATFKAEQTSIETCASARRSGLVDRKLVSLVSTNSNRSQGTYRGERIWIEWKEWDPNHQFPTWGIMIEDRIKKLAALLGLDNTPKEFRAPTCLGLFKDRDDDIARYGLIYRHPQEIPATAEPVSLLHLIRTSPKPTLTQRAVLAHTVAQSLMYLHSVNWLHKGFRSDSIVFFTTPNEAPDYASPIISGFEYARPDLPEELTEKPCESFSHDLYRHPDALINAALRSKKSWDIYSLAIVLIEIAMWQGINDIVDIQEGQRGARTKLRKIREVLLEDKFLAALAGAIGERYCDVVRRCLSGGLALGVEDGADESDPHIGVNMLQVVAVGVVGKLASIQT